MPSQLEFLPPELILTIIKYLNAKDRAHLFAVSSRFYEIKNEHYNQKVRIVIRNSFGNSLHKKLLNNCIRLCAQQPTELRNDLEEAEIKVIEDVHSNAGTLSENVHLISLYFNATQLILAQSYIAYGEMENDYQDLLSYLLRLLPNLQMLQIIFYKGVNLSNTFMPDTLDLLKKQTQLCHLTLFSRCASSCEQDRHFLEILNGKNYSLWDALHHLKELYFRAFRGSNFNATIQNLFESPTSICRLGFYNDRFESCLKHLDFVNSSQTKQITHLTLHSFANDYATNIGSQQQQLELLKKQFCGLKVVYPTEAKGLFQVNEEKCNLNQ